MFFNAILSIGAFFLNGNQLYEYCADGPSSDVNTCRIYIAGAADMLETTQKNGGKVLVCSPGNATARQTADIVTLYMRNNPATREKAASSIVIDALMSAYPCTRSGK